MLFPRKPSPKEKPRVVITGTGIVTALGIGWKANAEGFRTGKTAFRPVSLFDVSRQKVKTAAEVDLPEHFPPAPNLPGKGKGFDRGTRMLFWAFHDAWEQAGWKEFTAYPLVLGTTSGGMLVGEQYYHQTISHSRSRKQQPSRALHYLAHTQARHLMESYGLEGPVHLIANACASGTDAIGLGWNMIRSGGAERVMVGGYDSLSLMVFSGFNALQALSPTWCRPFDQHRDGLALGEGAAVLALETLESAQNRKATILGEIIGYASYLDLHHLTQPQPDGNAAFQVMVQACKNAGIHPHEVNYVNAHGTGTPHNDNAEALAINRWAADAVTNLFVSSIKSSIGHLLGGAGAVEAVASLMTLRENWLPPEMNVQTVDPVCQFKLVQKAMDLQVSIVASNSFGFGGTNACLIMQR